MPAAAKIFPYTFHIKPVKFLETSLLCRQAERGSSQHVDHWLKFASHIEKPRTHPTDFDISSLVSPFRKDVSEH